MRKYGPYDCSKIIYKFYLQSFENDLLKDDVLSDKTIDLSKYLEKYVSKSKRFNIMQGPAECGSRHDKTKTFAVWTFDLYDTKKETPIGWK